MEALGSSPAQEPRSKGEMIMHPAIEITHYIFGSFWRWFGAYLMICGLSRVFTIKLGKLTESSKSTSETRK